MNFSNYKHTYYVIIITYLLVTNFIAFLVARIKTKNRYQMFLIYIWILTNNTVIDTNNRRITTTYVHLCNIIITIE